MGISYKGETVFTKAQVASILDVDERTIDRYIISNKDELSKNGYSILKGGNILDFKQLLYVNDIRKSPSLGLFTFRALLNLAMLLVESEKAREIRSRILNIVMLAISNKVGDRTYINQRDADYSISNFY